MSESAIEIKNLVKSFGKVTVLKGITLNLNEEENLVVLGKSGSGKSVLIKLIINLLHADSGSITVFGKDITTMNTKDMSEIRTQIGFLFQSGALYDSMSVRENMEFPLRRIKKELTEEMIDTKVKEVLKNVGLSEAYEKMPSELSGGMRKRLGLARTIVVDPKIVLYDEPTTGLDPTTSDEISTLILEVQKKYKASSIIITHDMACARKVANRVVILHEGEVYKIGTLSEFEKSEDKIVKSFFDDI